MAKHLSNSVDCDSLLKLSDFQIALLKTQIETKDTVIFKLEEKVFNLNTIHKNHLSTIDFKDGMIKEKDKQLRRQRWCKRGLTLLAGGLGTLLIFKIK